MKRLLFMAALLLTAAYSRAQQTMAFPFQGGKDVMMDFFKKNVVIPEELKKTKATGTAVLKFTADPKGAIKKIVVYYADDYTIAVPFIDALKKSDRKWIIPDDEKLHDFVISFTVNLIMPDGKASAATQKQVYDSYRQRKPIWASNPVPLDMTTLLPAIITTY
ncbi:hypothetical protein MUGA111182_16110 [Mucilaginibacter galii]|uniref:TonB C-terminal domain-containing protein n=1 Tax=Mucilaginibacter galii TaxID=2005073 RepID=A0A917JBQ8_9SPHI|nr:hypothetical protein [Mucilaginibacter galii]GGI52291.1 hypothetical protein GCM10011425_35030 [Mucilaginibacter galii]